MSSIVVDASVTLAWGFPDESNPYADAVLEQLEGRSMAVPALWAPEVTNALLVGERRKRLKLAQINRFIDLLEGLSIVQYTQPPVEMIRSLFLLAREHNLSAYDATYLELAIRENLPLATLDKNLQRAARNVGIVIYKSDKP